MSLLMPLKPASAPKSFNDVNSTSAEGPSDAQLQNMPAPAHVSTLKWNHSSVRERRALLSDKNGADPEGDASESNTAMARSSGSPVHRLDQFAQQQMPFSKHCQTGSPETSSSATGNAGTASNTEQAALEQITQQFQQRFADSAQNRDEFHALMKKTFGEQYNVSKAETIRQQTLKGDFGWMPKITLVNGEQLADISGTQAGGVGKGAYSAEKDTVYLSRDLLNGNPGEAEKILTEEVGHAIDARINVNDAKGDEGDIFSRLVHREEISSDELSALQQENDSGTINVNGEQVEVEYGWLSDAVDSVGDAFDSVGDFVQGNVIDPIKGVAEDVGEFVQGRIIDPVVGVVEDVGDIAVNGWETIGDIGQSIFSGGRDFLGNLFEGDFGGAWDALLDTGQEVFSEAAGYVVETFVMGGHALVSFVDGVLGLSNERGVTGDEEAYLRTIYGDSIDYSKVKIHSGGIKQAASDAFGLRAHVVGNDIYLPEKFFNEDGGGLNKEGLLTLSHEMGHIWQFQNDGAGYISEALEAQTFGDGYDWQKAVQNGVSFKEMNPEQQAEVAKMIGIVIASNENGQLTHATTNEKLGWELSDAEFAIIHDAHQRLLAGDV